MDSAGQVGVRARIRPLAVALCRLRFLGFPFSGRGAARRGGGLPLAGRRCSEVPHGALEVLLHAPSTLLLLLSLVRTDAMEAGRVQMPSRHRGAGPRCSSILRPPPHGMSCRRICCWERRTTRRVAALTLLLPRRYKTPSRQLGAGTHCGIISAALPMSCRTLPSNSMDWTLLRRHGLDSIRTAQSSSVMESSNIDSVQQRTMASSHCASATQGVRLSCHRGSASAAKSPWVGYSRGEGAHHATDKQGARC